MEINHDLPGTNSSTNHDRVIREYRVWRNQIVVLMLVTAPIVGLFCISPRRSPSQTIYLVLASVLMLVFALMYPKRSSDGDGR